VELRILLQAARKSGLLVASAALLGAILGLTTWYVLPDAYEASAVIVTDSTAITVPGQQPFVGDPERYVTGELESLRSYPVASLAAESMDPPPSPEELLAAIELTHITGSDVVEVTARAETPRRASAMANAVAATYINRRVEAAQAALDAQRAALEDQAEQLAARLADQQLAEPVANALYATYAQVNESIAELAKPGVLRDATRVVDTGRAAVSTRALGPVPTIGGAGLLGGLAGLGVAVVRTLRRPRVTGREEVEFLSGRPVSVDFPHVRGLSRMTPEGLLQSLAAPAGRLAALTSAGAPELGPLVITCCSATSPAGCSTVATALASRLADDGLRVTAVTVGGDRTPLALSPSTPDSAPGPKTGGSSASTRLPAAGGWHAADGVVGGLTVLSHSGPGPLTAEDYRKALAEQSSGADVVVVDASSLLDSAFAGVAARESHRVVLVVPALDQPESDLRLALDLLAEATDAPVHVAVTHL